MKIQKAKGKVSRFSDMNGGDVFLNNGIYYMKMMFLLECRLEEDYNAINLNNGKPIFFNVDDKFEMAKYDFIAK